MPQVAAAAAGAASAWALCLDQAWRAVPATADADTVVPVPDQLCLPLPVAPCSDRRLLFCCGCCCWLRVRIGPDAPDATTVDAACLVSRASCWCRVLCVSMACCPVSESAQKYFKNTAYKQFHGWPRVPIVAEAVCSCRVFSAKEAAAASVVGSVSVSDPNLMRAVSAVIPEPASRATGATLRRLRSA